VSRLLLDAGALIALDRDQRPMWRRFFVAAGAGTPLLTHGGVIGQVWRRPARQARLVRALRSIEVRPLDDELGKLAGRLLAASGTADVVDAALIVLSRPGDRIFTSDPDDFVTLAIAARAEQIEIVPV
jgi:hypothetical protein